MRAPCRASNPHPFACLCPAGVLLAAASLVAACNFMPPDPQAALITKGRDIFFNETFNTPPLVEAADTGPFFHNNAVETIEGAVAFYNGQAFNNSPSGEFLVRTEPNGIGIRLDATQVVAVAAFLRVINALENIRLAIELLAQSEAMGSFKHTEAREAAAAGSGRDRRQHRGSRRGRPASRGT